MGEYIMSLPLMDYGDLQQRMADAVSKEVKQVEKLRREVRKLSVRKLGYRPCKTIAPVATDGGENRLTFEPLNLEIIRVVDSEGQELISEVIAISEDDSVFRGVAARLLVMQSLLRELGVGFEDLSYLLGYKKTEAVEKVADNRGRVKAFRDILEWAVLLDLAGQAWPVDVLLLRDGLLRTKSIKRETFPKLDAAFRRVYDEQVRKGRRKVYMLGVAKSSAVLSKLGLALILEGTFERAYPCYAEVPKDLEAQCYNFDRTWLETAPEEEISGRQLYQSFGRLHLVKLSPMPDGPIFPVDVPVWLSPDKRQEILEYLVHDSSETFPTIGYPSALQRAHENAVLTGFEMTVLGDLMTEALKENVDESFTERLIRHIHLGKGLMKGGARRGG
jgi:hypothetical protein